MTTRIAVIGEGMIELSGYGGDKTTSESRSLNLNYGGDTVNTAVYLSRLGVDVSYISAVGDDPLSDWLIDQWSLEGVDCSMVEKMTRSTIGMYMVSVAEDGERSFHYWRNGSPASRAFDDPLRVDQLADSIKQYPFVYLSGISLAILPETSRKKLMDVLKHYKSLGGKIIFDGNYRAKLWASEAVATEAYMQLYMIADIALPTLEDEMELFSYESKEQALAAIKGWGVPEVILKMGENGCLAATEEGEFLVPTQPVKAVDTTAAGDSFNAGYLVARLKEGEPVQASCKAGHKMAGKVIQYPGAIIPLDS